MIGPVASIPRPAKVETEIAIKNKVYPFAAQYVHKVSIYIPCTTQKT